MIIHLKYAPNYPSSSYPPLSCGVLNAYWQATTTNINLVTCKRCKNSKRFRYIKSQTPITPP